MTAVVMALAAAAGGGDNTGRHSAASGVRGDIGRTGGRFSLSIATGRGDVRWVGYPH